MTTRTPLKNHNARSISLLLVFMLVSGFGSGLPKAHADGAGTGNNGDAHLEAVAEPEEIRLFELINAARGNPLATAVSLGMDRKKVLADNPDIADILKNGLPPLTLNEKLYQTAGAHATEMLDNNFYSYESIEGLKVAGRMEKAGYRPAVAGESLGLIFFNNYLDPLHAVSLMFENMFKHELAPDYSGPRKILNPEVREMASAVGQGSYEFPEFSANVYIAVCDFAQPVQTYELQLMNLVNQLRNIPGQVLAEYGIAADAQSFPELEPLFAKGLPPVAYNASLYAAADELVVDMFANGHFTGKTADGKTLAARVRSNGYKPSWIGEARVRRPACGAVPPGEGQTLQRIFRSVLAQAFRADPQKRGQAMLAGEAVDGAIRIKGGNSPELGGICGNDVHLMVADFGAQQPPGEGANSSGSRLIGLVFDDLDMNGIYNVGEGLPEAEVILDKGPDSDIQHQTRVNAAGGYTISLHPGNFRVSVNVGDERFSKWIRIEDGVNTWLSTVVEMPGRQTGI